MVANGQGGAFAKPKRQFCRQCASHPPAHLASRPLALALPSRPLLMPSRLPKRLDRRSVSDSTVRLLPRVAPPAVRLEWGVGVLQRRQGGGRVETTRQQLAGWSVARKGGVRQGGAAHGSAGVGCAGPAREAGRQSKAGSERLAGQAEQHGHTD